MSNSGLHTVQMELEKKPAAGSGDIRVLDGRVVHASEFIPGFVTFVGTRERGVWWMKLC